MIEELKYLEWNVHAMGGTNYTIPSFITNYIKDVHVFVLVEFCESKGFDIFRDNLKDFDLYCSLYKKGYNQVCIGIRKSLDYKLLSISSVNVCDENIPEFLQVDIEICEKSISILGVRIKTESETINNQIDFLKKRLETPNSFICLGDFNARFKFIKKNLSEVAAIYGPRTSNRYYSFVHKNGKKVALDWLLVKNDDTEVYNGYPDKDYTPYATFDWSFVSNENGYENKSSYDFLGLSGLPDHAILKGMIRL